MSKIYSILAILLINFMWKVNAQPGEFCLKATKTCIGLDLICTGPNTVNGTCQCPATAPVWNPRLYKCLTYKTAYDIISSVPSQIMNTGDWGVNEFCDPSDFAIGFRNKIQTWQGSGYDDTAMNGFELICSNKKRVKSSEGPYGFWGNETYCPNNTRVVGFSILMDDSASGDNTAANAVRLVCDDGTILISSEMPWGTWAGPFNCQSGFNVCGLQTQVQPDQGPNVDDNTLNNVKMFCCKYNV